MGVKDAVRQSFAELDESCITQAIGPKKMGFIIYLHMQEVTKHISEKWLYIMAGHGTSKLFNPSFSVLC